MKDSVNSCISLTICVYLLSSALDEKYRDIRIFRETVSNDAASSTAPNDYIVIGVLVACERCCLLEAAGSGNDSWISDEVLLDGVRHG